MTLKINGEPVAAEGFMFDGCHKIYLIDGPEARRSMIEDSGWSADDIRPLSELPQAWESSCSLRFINSGDLKTAYVPQMRDEDPTIEWVEENPLSDTQALDLIAKELSGQEWSPDTLDVIAAYVRGTGRAVDDVEVDE